MFRTKFPNQVISILLLSLFFCAFSTQKFKRIGLNVDYTSTAQVGEEVKFRFNAGDNIYLVRIFSDNKSLGTAKMEENSAELSFLFNYAGVKKLRFVGVNAENETASEVYGDLVITGKTFNEAVTIINENATYTTYNPQVIISPASSPFDVPSKKEEANYDYSLPTNSNVGLFVFKPTPNEDPNGRNENVYSTAIGHPNADDIRMFFENIHFDAIELSKRYQVPASVIMAMAALESGFGFSRNAIYANNLFGIKQWKGNPSNAYQLKGQPDENEGKVPILSITSSGQIIFNEENRPDNWFKRFNSRSECLAFLVEEIFLHKTGIWKRDYSEIAKFYRDQLAVGVEKYSAAYTFSYGIGERGYTHKGGKFYADRIMKIVDKYNLIELD